MKRFPRERFTRALATICERLDREHDLVIAYQSPKSTPCYLFVSGQLRINVTEVRAFGSWARGSLDCADLDLLATIRSEWVGPITDIDGKQRGSWSTPGFGVARKALMGSLPHVHVQDLDWAIAHQDTSAFKIDEAIPIWKPGSDWRGAMAAIQADPAAGRAPRSTDQLVLRLEQMDMDLREAESAIAAREEGLIDWEFFQHQGGREDYGNLRAAERRLSWELAFDCKDESLISRTLVATRNVRTKYRSQVSYRFGACGIWPTMFHGNKHRAICITPRWSQVGPNGTLVVTKGPNHSDKAAEAFSKQRSRRQ